MEIDHTVARRLSLRVVHGPAFEALLSLGLAGGEMPLGQYTDGEALKLRYERLPERLRGLIKTVDSGFAFNWTDIIGFLSEGDAPQTLPEAVDRIARMEPVDLKLAMLGYHVVGYRKVVGEDLFREAAHAGAAAVKKFRLRAKRHGRGGGPLVSLPPDLVAGRTIEILRSLPTEFYLPDARAAGSLRASAESACELAQTLAAEAVVERLTRGIVFSGEPGISDLLLIPNLVSRPWSLVLEHEATKIFSYPIRVPQDPDRPQPELVELYRALGDETRLRLLKRLRKGQTSFGRLSRELRLAKSTLHHHVVVLRNAGLVQIHLADETGPVISPELPALDRLLKDYLDS